MSPTSEEEVFRLLAENIQHVFWLADLRGPEMLYFSPAYESIWGRSVQSLLADFPRTFIDTIHPDDRDRVAEALRETHVQAHRRGEPTDIEYRVVRPDGEARWIRDRAFPVRDASGRFYRVAGIAQDVTERRQAVQALRHREQEFRALVENSPDVVARFDRELRHVYVNPAVERAMGLPPQALIGKNHVELGMPEPLADLWRAALRRVFETGREDSIEYRFLSPAGPRTFHSRVVPEFDPQGQVEFVLGITRDITARVQAEEALRYQKTLLEAQSEASPDGVLVVSADGKMVSFNRRFVEMWGIPEDVASGRSDEAALRAVHAKLVNPREFMARVAYLYEHPDETSHEDIDLKDARVFERHSAPVRSADGLHYGRIWTFRDITGRKRAEQERERLLAAERAARAEAGAAQQRLAFVAEASGVLASSLDYDTTLQSVARLAVPYFADWCVVDIAEEGAMLRQVAVAHADPDKEALVRELRQRYPPDPAEPHPIFHAMHTGQPELAPAITDSDLAARAHSTEHLQLLRALCIRSHLVVPMTARERTFGAISFILAESGRRYGEAEVAFAQELARRAALAVDNARLYREAQQLNAELEQRVTLRTAELQAAIDTLQDEVEERREAEQQLESSREQLRELSAHLQGVREEERTQIAREIHDELGQALTSLKMDVFWLQKSLAPGQEALQQRARDMTRLIDSTIKTVRRIATELRPGILDDFGLVAAIEWQLQEFQGRSDIRCQLKSEVEDFDLDPDRATAIFRIFQETLTNVARHARATRVEVWLEKADDSLHLQVHDNGRGITEAETFGSKSLGLLGMRERVHLLDGQIEIRGGPGHGTTVDVRVPLAPPGA